MLFVLASDRQLALEQMRHHRTLYQILSLGLSPFFVCYARDRTRNFRLSLSHAYVVRVSPGDVVGVHVPLVHSFRLNARVPLPRLSVNT